MSCALNWSHQAPLEVEEEEVTHSLGTRYLHLFIKNNNNNNNSKILINIKSTPFCFILSPPVSSGLLKLNNQKHDFTTNHLQDNDTLHLCK